jgi:hypothetical protein
VCARTPRLSPILFTSIFLFAFHRTVDPNTFGDPYLNANRQSVVSTSSNGIDSAWRRRQTIKRGVTRKVKLTHGNFIAEYPVPTPILSAVENKWKNVNTTEFSYVSFFPLPPFLITVLYRSISSFLPALAWLCLASLE